MRTISRALLVAVGCAALLPAWADAQAKDQGIRLKQGKVTVHWRSGLDEIAKWDMPETEADVANNETASLRLVWKGKPSGRDYFDALFSALRSFAPTEHRAPRTEHPPPAVTKLRIPHTSFWLLLFDGRPVPVIWDSQHDELWRLDGLHEWKDVNLLEPDDGKVTLTMWAADFYRVWYLDFSDAGAGLRIQYTFDGGW